MSGQFRSPRRPGRLAAGIGATIALAALIAVAAAAARPLSLGSHAAPLVRSSAAAHSCLVMTGSGDPAFVKNFNPFTATGLPSGQFVKGAIYEGLTVSPEGGKPTLPWLARSWKWSNGNKTLTLQIAKGVKWSDGQPLTVKDVVYSLVAGKQDKTMDILGITRPDTNVASIRSHGSAVSITLKTPDSQFIASTLNGVIIVPQHIWSKVTDAATFTNSAPVGSGPFTRITRFTTQDYVLTKNPHYWQAGKPLIGCLEYVQAASNDAALALIQSGQVDWSHNFVPNVDKAYTNKDKAHFHAFYATTAYPVSLVFDNTQYPYSLVAFRHALSMAIDRTTVSKLGEYGYAPPTDAIGLNGLFPQWVTDASVKAQSKQLSTYNPTAAKKLLTDNGFTYKGNKLYDPKGNAVSLDIHVISGWSDWVASNQIITQNLQGIGIDSNVKLEPDWNSWFPNAFATKNPTLLWQTASQASPYGYFNANLSQNSLIPPGQDASTTGNWSHTYNAQATGLLDQWKVSLNSAKQHTIATQLEKLFLDNMPIVPLFIGPRWSTYSTRYFHCFNSPKNFYGDPIFSTYPDNLLSFTRICPGGKAGA
ncbi:MAG: peptide/nickel transport system substrate-binding protein [Gaiellaceae bacterium]|nr:peptide/nickel transport system substrate-binding protein [Gaiellaceae bacterium]